MPQQKEQQKSSILFLIGNGFDLGLNMKTSYADVYETYVKTPSKSEVIQNFKNELSKRKPLDKWSDFEMGMADYAKTLSNESELIECVRDFKSHMIEHLQAENDKMLSLIKSCDDAYKLYEELDQSFTKFYSSLTPNVKTKLNQIVGNINRANFNIITFNYTTVLDELIALKSQFVSHQMPLAYLWNISEIAKPLHIHGTLNQAVVLGVDNAKQLQNLTYKLSKRGSRAFIKTYFNQNYDDGKVLQAKKLIAESSVICTYGFSMGESDKTWIDLLIEWLKDSPDHHLIIYQYDQEKYPMSITDALMDTEEDKKKILSQYLKLTDPNLLEQIHIPIGYDIFNFNFIRVEAHTPPTPKIMSE